MAAGQGQDVPPLDEAEKARLRGQAREWLQAELTAWGKILESSPPQDGQAISQILGQWQRDPALAGIRDAAALAQLPAEERSAFLKLWANVAESLKAANTRFAAFVQEQLPAIRNELPPGSPQLAGVLAQIGMTFLEQKQWAEAEPVLRECLAIREKNEPEDWRTFNTQSMLGGALLGQQKYADAEPLLLAGYLGMKEREQIIPDQGKVRLSEALERLIDLYTATAKPDEVRKWRAEQAK